MGQTEEPKLNELKRLLRRLEKVEPVGSPELRSAAAQPGPTPVTPISAAVASGEQPPGALSQLRHVQPTGPQPLTATKLPVAPAVAAKETPPPLPASPAQATARPEPKPIPPPLPVEQRSPPALEQTVLPPSAVRAAPTIIVMASVVAVTAVVTAAVTLIAFQWLKAPRENTLATELRRDIEVRKRADELIPTAPLAAEPVPPPTPPNATAGATPPPAPPQPAPPSVAATAPPPAAGDGMPTPPAPDAYASARPTPGTQPTATPQSATPPAPSQTAKPETPPAGERKLAATPDVAAPAPSAEAPSSLISTPQGWVVEPGTTRRLPFGLSKAAAGSSYQVLISGLEADATIKNAVEVVSGVWLFEAAKLATVELERGAAPPATLPISVQLRGLEGEVIERHELLLLTAPRGFP